MSDPQTLPDVVQRYLDAYNRRDVAALVACVSESVVFENVSNGAAPLRLDGRTAFAHLAAQAAETFPVRRLQVRTAVVSGDRVALEVDWSGTPSVDIGGVRAGETMTLRGASFFRIADEALVSIVDLS